MPSDGVIRIHFPFFHEERCYEGTASLLLSDVIRTIKRGIARSGNGICIVSLGQRIEIVVNQFTRTRDSLDRFWYCLDKLEEIRKEEERKC